MSPTYRKITYPRILDNRITHWFWKRIMCARGHHLFDEVLSTMVSEGEDFEQPGWGHYLYCDACGLDITIAKVRK